MAKRPLLVVGAGAVVVTVLEGIACGNPVAPRCPGGQCQPMPMPIDASGDAVNDGQAVTPDARIDATDASKP